uniref:Peptidase M12A domain-containing protein n=1 Tax=Rhizophagus irregularis (strain DAOM 181602 / DAOM 197198 / MUCL 43194) TaxID=747089 RepID=U9ST96_RHIID
MYALGFYHEHCRPDRDNYWTVTAKEILEKINHALSLGCYSGGRRIQAKPGTERTNAIVPYDINALNALYPSSSYLPLRRSLKMKAEGRFRKEEVDGGIRERE